MVSRASYDETLQLRTSNESLRGELESLKTRFQGEIARINHGYQQEIQVYKNMIVELRPGLAVSEPFDISKFLLSKTTNLEFISWDILSTTISNHTHFTFQKEMLMDVPRRLDNILDRLNSLNCGLKELLTRDMKQTQ